MKIGIISDTHDHLPNIRRAVEIFNVEKIDALIHAGDFIAPFSLLPFRDLNLPIFAVYGNNDGERVGLQARAKKIGFEIHDRFYQFDLGGAHFMIDHYPLEAEAALKDFGNCDYIITGHTHKQKIEKLEEGPLMINPGEACGYVEGQNLIGVLQLGRGDYRSIEIMR